MSDFKDYPLPQLYGNCGQGPQDPTKVNWTSVAISAGIIIGGAIVLGLAINFSVSRQIEQSRLHTEKLHQAHLAALEKHEANMREIISQRPKVIVLNDSDKETNNNNLDRV